MSTVIHGRCTSARVQGRIAEVIGKPVDEIWPPREKLPKVDRKGAAA